MSNVSFLPLRREDPALLRGGGCFTADLQAPQALHAVFVRSPLAYGRIRQIDTRAAHAAEGVVAVLTAQTLTDDGHAVYMPAPNPLLPIAQLPPMEPLARDRVVYVGQPVALVLAHTLAQAQRAADQVQLQLEPLQALPDFGDESPITQVHHRQGGGAKPTDLAPTVRVEASMEVPRVLAMAMESRGMLAIWQGPMGEQGESLTVHFGTQSPSRAQANIAATRASVFPRILLTAGVGVASQALAGLLSGGAWNLQPAISMPLFDFGRTEATLDAAKARQKLANSRGSDAGPAGEEPGESRKGVFQTCEDVAVPEKTAQLLQGILAAPERGDGEAGRFFRWHREKLQTPALPIKIDEFRKRSCEERLRPRARANAQDRA